jgi:hypothetical protein
MIETGWQWCLPAAAWSPAKQHNQADNVQNAFVCKYNHILPYFFGFLFCDFWGPVVQTIPQG